MEAFRKLEATAATIQIANIDTDQIIPARFLKTPRSTDHGQFLFHDMRRAKDGELPRLARTTAPAPSRDMNERERCLYDEH